MICIMTFVIQIALIFQHKFNFCDSNYDSQCEVKKQMNIFIDIKTISDVESEFEDNERKLNELSAQLVGLNCNMLIHLQVIEAKANYHRTCTPPGTYEPEQDCTCPPGAMEPVCTPTSVRRDVSYNR